MTRDTSPPHHCANCGSCAVVVIWISADIQRHAVAAAVRVAVLVDIDESETTFVLVGSSISMMEEATLLGDSPLYGRTSLILDIRELSFDAATKFLQAEQAECLGA